MEMSNVTSGPVVNESLETSFAGVFACGNVLHVHDLVDYVSEEASKAGQKAAEYISSFGEEVKDDAGVIRLVATDGVRYTVPAVIRPSMMDDLQTVRFRVGNVYKDTNIAVYFGDKLQTKLKKRVLAPGEMEQVILKKSDIEAAGGIDSITIKVED